MRVSKPLFRNILLLSLLVVILVAAAIASVRDEQNPRAQAVTPFEVPDGYEIVRVAGPEILSYPMFAILAGEGRLFVFESTEANTMTTEEMLADPSYHIRLLEDVDGDRIYDRSHLFAENLPFPMGGAFYEGSLYVSAAPHLLRLEDMNGDWVADEREVLLTGWTLNRNGAALGGPFLGPDGWLYLTDARRGFHIERKEGDVVSGRSARIWRLRPDGTGLEWISGGGFDNAIELAFMPSGETIGTMTYFVEPQTGLRDALMHWVEGGVYPKPQPVIEQDSFKLTGDLMPTMTKLARVAPSGIMRYEGSALGQEFDGNLFSVQFNTGRLLRHVIERDGATFRTTESPFVTSTSPDTHPTDVLQDADGSLLLVETGGWFINGCPLSRVAKPDVQGGIYRIRKIGAAPVHDPWGRELELDTESPQQLVAHLSDSRKMVRDHTIQRLVKAGGAAIGPLRSLLDQAEEEVRTAAVFALYRIGTPAAMEPVRDALDDPSVTVRTAAARVIGMSRDRGAVDRLMVAVQNDEPPVRRQAATALGQIGDVRAHSALLEAAANPDDRFVEHAVIHSLITFGDSSRLFRGLRHSSSKVRRASLIALDQMDHSPLRREHLAPFLESSDPELWQPGIWVASHHPGWSDAVVDFLARRLDAPELVGTEVTSVRDLAITFCADGRMQAIITDRLRRAQVPAGRKLLLLEVIDRCPVQELPPSWIQQLSGQLRGTDAQLRSRALRVIESRGVKSLQDELVRIADDEAASTSYRLDALSALVSAQPALSDSHFQFLTTHLHSRHEAPIRQLAAKILAQAELSREQLLTLARYHLAGSDVFLLPRLVSAFQGSTSPAVGQALIAALQTSTDRLENLPEEDLQSILEQYPASVQEAAEPLLAVLRAQHAARVDRLEAIEEQLGMGDVDAGRKLFLGKGTCNVCHSVAGDGGSLGPDLTNIGEIRSRRDILEAIVFPSASFAREYETYRVSTATNSYTGIITEQFTDALILSVGPEAQIRIPREDIEQIETLSISMMPPGLDQALTEAGMANLMAYLEALPPQLDRLIRIRERQ